MIEFGKTLREAREAKGLTVEQVADTTRIMPSMIEALEAENFSKIAAPLYGRGFVKLYCTAIGLDPEPLVAEFMEIYNGNRDTGIKDRLPEPMPAIVANAEEPVAEEPAPETEAGQAPQPDLFSAPVSPAAQPEAQPATGTGSSSSGFSRYAPPVRQHEEEYYRPPVTRWLILAVCAAAAAIVLFFGLRALYRATSAPRTDVEAPPSTEAISAPTAAKPAATAKPDATRVPQKIPSLYVD